MCFGLRGSWLRGAERGEESAGERSDVEGDDDDPTLVEEQPSASAPGCGAAAVSSPRLCRALGLGLGFGFGIGFGFGFGSSGSRSGAP